MRRLATASRSRSRAGVPARHLDRSERKEWGTGHPPYWFMIASLMEPGWFCAGQAASDCRSLSHIRLWDRVRVRVLIHSSSDLSLLWHSHYTTVQKMYV